MQSGLGSRCTRMARAAAFVSILAGSANATPEHPLRFGARSLAMGGTGVAHVNDASAAAINPAGLDAIESATVMLTASPFIPTTDWPFSADRSQETETAIVPLFFAGAALRVLEPLTVGAAFYAASGISAEYDALPEYAGLDMMLNLGVLEAAIPVSYRINEHVSVGAALRFAHAILETDLPIPFGEAAGPLRLEMDIAGNAFPGVLVGVMVQLLDSLSLGATYRSKMTIDLEGSGTATHPFVSGPLDVSASWSTAHAFRVGGAWWAIPERLLVSLDVAYTLLDEAVNGLPIHLEFRSGDLAGAPIDQEVELNWQDSIAALVGGEYWLTERFAARAGYHAARSGTRERYAEPLSPPPGIIQTVHAGGGLRLTHWRADVGAAYAFVTGGTVRRENEAPAEIGGGYWLLGASLAYHH